MEKYEIELPHGQGRERIDDATLITKSETGDSQEDQRKKIPLQDLRSFLFIQSDKLCMFTTLEFSCERESGCQTAPSKDNEYRCPLHPKSKLYLNYISGDRTMTELGFPDALHSPESSPRTIYSYGYVGNFLKTKSAINKLRRLCLFRRKPAIPGLLPDCGSTALQLFDALVDPRQNNRDVQDGDQGRGRLIDNSMTHVLDVVQGPPGTGKTKLISDIVKKNKSTDVFLLTANQNKAVEALAMALEGALELDRDTGEDGAGDGDGGGSSSSSGGGGGGGGGGAAHQFVTAYPVMVVICSERNDRVGPTARKYSLHTAVENDEKVKNASDYLAFALQSQALQSDSEALKRLRKQLADTRKDALRRILSFVRVVVCSICELSKLQRKDFKALRTRLTVGILDEAGYTPEHNLPEIVMTGVPQLLCVGDVNQLPPFTYVKPTRGSSTIRRFSFLNRIICQTPELLDEERLNVQYRMHESIARAVSDIFYKGALQTAPQLVKYWEDRRTDDRGIVELIRGLGWMNCIGDLREQRTEPQWQQQRRQQQQQQQQQHQQLQPLPPQEQQQSSSGNVSYEEEMKSLHNPYERKVVRRILHDLFTSKGFTLHVAVLSFYKLQVEALKKEIEAYPMLREALEKRKLEILTVDSSQGNEYDIVIVSAVRSNDRSNVGFLTQEGEGANRVNVAISRAKQSCLIVGDNDTLLHHNLFKEIWKRAENHNDINALFKKDPFADK